MSTIQESIEVTVPVNIAYNQWTQFEEFPRFMEGVKSVQQYEDTRLRWLVEVGKRRTAPVRRGHRGLRRPHPARALPVATPARLGDLCAALPGRSR